MTTDENQTNTPTPSNRLIMVLGGIAALALIGVIVLSVALFRGGQNGRADDNLSPTPFSNNPAPGEAPIVFGVSQTEVVTASLNAPMNLSIGPKAFELRAERLSADGVWTPDFASDDEAIWVYGSVVNYVIGIPDSSENRALIEQQQVGDEIVLNTQQGNQLAFSVESRNTVPTTNTDVFRQTQPGITIVLTGAQGDERLVLFGRYEADEAEDRTGSGVGLNETAQLEDLQVTVTSVSFVPDRPEVPDGFAFYQVNYEIQNVGLTAYDTAQLTFVLLDGTGNQYALNAVASQVGNFPALTGFLNAGEIRQATAGYQIPLGLSSSALSWVVTKMNSGAQLQFIIPFTGSPTSSGRNTQVVLSSADVGPNLTTLVLTGEIINLNTQPIVVTAQDIVLQGTDGSSYLLLSTNPALPWTVAPGESLPFSLIYQPPVTDTAVFTLYNQSFQLSGFR